MNGVSSHNRCISVVIVSYNSASELAELLPELAGMTPAIPLDIIVVDNASADGSSGVAARVDGVRLISNSRNLGFSRAVNQGVARARCPQVLLLNPDARIPAESLLELSRFLARHPDVAAVAPRLEFPDGAVQSSRGSFPNLLIIAAHLLNLKRLMPSDEKVFKSPLRLFGRFFRQYRPPEAEETVDYTIGACVLLRKSCLDAVGGFDEDFFLYYDEIDLARRLANKGFRWVALNTCVAYHKVAQSSSQNPIRPFLERYRSMILYFKKHKKPWEVFIVRGMVAMMTIVRFGAASLFSAFRLNPKIPREEEMKMYRELLSLCFTL